MDNKDLSCINISNVNRDVINGVRTLCNPILNVHYTVCVISNLIILQNS